MEYQKPGILNSFLAIDLYASASGFASATGDDGAFCVSDTHGGGVDAVCP